MTLKIFFTKVKSKLWFSFVSNSQHTNLYPYIYHSFWYFLSHKSSKKVNTCSYFASQPNPGAGIGHQMANWIAGYWFAGVFNLKFAHIPFSSEKWDVFLGFGEGEVCVSDLVKQGFKKVLLPLFNENNENEIDLIQKIIASYAGKRIVFITEQDQSYMNQYGEMDELKRKFYTAKARENEKLIYSKDNFNIAIHVRRGDITIGQLNKNPNLLMRWQDNDYFVNVLTNVLKTIKIEKPIVIYLFSQGKKSDFHEFENFPNIVYCLDIDAMQSFLHLVYADLLITSKSSFSYKPALLSNGIKVCPKNFWHGYPESEDWILAEEEGNFLKK